MECRDVIQILNVCINIVVLRDFVNLSSETDAVYVKFNQFCRGEVCFLGAI